MVSIKWHLSSFDRAVGGHATEKDGQPLLSLAVQLQHNSQPLHTNYLRMNTAVVLQSLY